jgi:hypothetical protein
LKNKFKQLHTQVVNLNFSSIIDELFQHGTLSADDNRSLQHAADPLAQAKQLLALLHTSAHPQAFVRLRHAICN